MEKAHKPTPQQVYAQRLGFNYRMIDEMKRAKGGMWNLSPEAREKFDEFITLAFRDTKFIKDQKDLYRAENQNQEVIQHNKRERVRSINKAKKDMMQNISVCLKCKNSGLLEDTPYYKTNHPLFCVCKLGKEALSRYKEEKGLECLRCDDTGNLLGHSDQDGKSSQFCKCAVGIKKRQDKQDQKILDKHPNWKEGVITKDQWGQEYTEPKSVHLCLDCKAAFEYRQVHRCNGVFRK